MGFLALRELRSSTAHIDHLIERDGSVIVTNHGKPAYLIVGIDEESLEETLIDLRRVRATRALTRMQRRSTDLGNDTLPLDEVNAEIAAARSATR